MKATGSSRPLTVPYSEAQFKTLKYRPGFPARFDTRTLDDFRATIGNGMSRQKMSDQHHGHATEANAGREPQVKVVNDAEATRLKPEAARHLMPPWQRIARRRGNAKRSSS